MKIAKYLPTIYFADFGIFFKKAHNEIYAIVSYRNGYKTLKLNLCKIFSALKTQIFIAENIYRFTVLQGKQVKHR